jgi:hypothetical protein
MLRSVRILAGPGVAVLLMLAAPVHAASTMVMSTAEKIELVRDLPNESAFEYDGQYYDLGYLYSTERVNGADVTRSGSGFVLYHDDRFVRLDPDKLAMITDVLGEDPTEGYIPPAASRSTASSTSASATGTDPYAGTPVPDRTPTPRKSGAGAFGIIGGIFLLMIVAGIRFMMRSAIGFAFSPFTRNRRGPTSIDYADPFESRVNARLAEIDNERFRSGGAAESRVPAGYEPSSAQPAAPVARGFGRKQV